MNSPRQPSRGDRRHALLALGVALVTRGYLGVSIQDLNKDLAQSFGMDDTDGGFDCGRGAGDASRKGGPQERRCDH
jgi:S1-C subfamily serine protease